MAASQPTLIVLDLMLPDIDGIEVCRRIRKSSDVPILMLTARDEDVDKIIGLEVGADDYLTKPFNPRELVARVKSILRRTGSERRQIESKQIRHGDLLVDAGRREVRVGEEEIQLAPKEFDLLWELLDHRGLVLTRDQLLERVWGYTFAGDTRTVDVHVNHLRDHVAGALDDDGIADTQIVAAANRFAVAADALDVVLVMQRDVLHDDAADADRLEDLALLLRQGLLALDGDAVGPEDAPQGALARRAAGSGEATGPGRRGGPARAAHGRRTGRAARVGGRPRARRRERHLVHRVPARLLVDPSSRRRPEGAATRSRRGGQRAGAVLRGPGVPVLVLVHHDPRSQSRRRPDRRRHRETGTRASRRLSRA